MSRNRLLTLFCLATLVTALAAGGAASAAEPGAPGVSGQDAPLVQPDASGTNTITTLDSGGWSTSVAIGKDGLPLIIYHAGNLKGGALLRRLHSRHVNHRRQQPIGCRPFMPQSRLARTACP